MLVGIYYLLGQKTYRRNLQYRAAHIIDNLGSALFGFIMIYIWKSVGANHAAVGSYTIEMLVLWAALGQALFHVSVQAPHGLNIQLAVRTGSISIDFLRPINFFLYVMSREAGQQIYNLIYKGIPLYVLYALTVGYYVPAGYSILLLVPTCLLALYVCLCMAYLVGLASFITTDIRWATTLHMSLYTALSGVMMPTDLLPLGNMLKLTPWAVMVYYPGRVYFGLDGANALTVPILWALILTALCLWSTARARRSLEVQGG